MSWKTFNLKRQLSKVNMKIGGGSSNVNTEMEAMRNSSSIFYTAPPKESSPEGEEQPTPISAVAAAGPGASSLPAAAEALECREDDLGLATVTAMLNCETAAAAEKSSSDLPAPAPPQQTRRVEFETMQPPSSESGGERPSNLPLSEQQQQQSQQAPMKPTRQKFKEKARDQRLLSVPNIKYQPREQRGGGGTGIGAGVGSSGSGAVGRVNKNDVSPMMSGSLTKKIRKYDCVKALSLSHTHTLFFSVSLSLSLHLSLSRSVCLSHPTQSRESRAKQPA